MLGPEPKVGAPPVKVTASLMYPPGSSVLVSLMHYECFGEANAKVEFWVSITMASSSRFRVRCYSFTTTARGRLCHASLQNLIVILNREKTSSLIESVLNRQKNQ
jgi:hypothetical protein